MAENVRPMGGRFPLLKKNAAALKDARTTEEFPLVLKANTALEDIAKAHSIQEHSDKFELEFADGVYPTEDLPHDEEIFIEGVDGATRIETALALFTDIIRRINAGEVKEIVASATDVNGNKLTWTI